MIVSVSELDDAALRDALRELSITMSLSEARKVAELIGRDPTDTELTLFDTMWSEHCSYKSSRRVLKQHLPTEAGNVIVPVGEDAGVIRFGEIDGVRYGIVVAHESHNHPSQVMPVEGAATGIGGVVRDVYCMGADVIGVLDPLRFGDPEGAQSERSVEIMREVMEGIAMYGNALGVPNLGGDVVFDACYDDNCLVNVVAIGVVREDHIVHSRVPKEAADEPYDLILVGKPTDWSGMGGAAFASADLDHAAALDNKGSVQVADPFLKRVLVVANRAVLEFCREQDVTIGFKDLGAGGIACVSSELADAGGFGIELDLAHANLAEGDLPDRVAACSETQERFALAVPQRLTDDVLRIYNETYEIGAMYDGAGAVRLGRILPPQDGEPRMYRLKRGDEVLVDVPVELITEGIRYDRPANPRQPDFSEHPLLTEGRDVTAVLPQLLGSPHLCSRRELYQHYDSEVQGRTAMKPGNADAGLTIPVPGHAAGLAVTVDGNPRVARVDPYLGGVHAVVEAARNLACVGGVPAAVTDCLNFGNPENPEVFHDFELGVQGIGDACRGLGRIDAEGEPLPVVSGNVSFYNQSSSGSAVAPSPIVCGLGIVSDVGRSRSLSLKTAGNPIFRVGAFTPELGGSVVAHVLDPDWRGAPPPVDFEALRAEIRTVLEAYHQQWAQAIHDVSEGGTVVAVAEMALGPNGDLRRGARIDLGAFAGAHGDFAAAFGESGAFLVEVDADSAAAFEEAVARHGASFARIGEVTDESTLRVDGLQQGGVMWSLDELADVRELTMPRLLNRRADEGGAA
ncbi:MAG TPA: phosphoribosylformylglycinamidine synthase subunit PurL [Candidatus Krumholzibacteria bacterium]|nr:phosphoribosylformylglycinamidine synthase subunit PurL [Candidatus Krumholzibacteria bacterium]